ncbi:hypothetical protein L208DRAFT_1427107 [Tricholoma matsutake]|nr:hypothetical protein L208DRAFT_1427107 [Tricholoma matsutake 945]
MCGIFFSLRWDEIPFNSTAFVELSHKLQVANSARGPDAQGFHRVFVNPAADEKQPSLILEFFASQLRLRGHASIVQPHEKEGNVLCWNGEIFDGLDVSEISLQENDGVRLFQKLHSLKSPEQIRDVFATIEGPYAFIYYHAFSQCLFFARDPLGRRSLLIHEYTPESPCLILTSVSAGVDSRYNFEELCTDSIYCLDLHNLGRMEAIDGKFSCYIPLHRSPHSSIATSTQYAVLSKVSLDIPPEDTPPVEFLDKIPEHLVVAVNDLIYHLNRSVMLRVVNIPPPPTANSARLAVLFSGGIDSTVIAYFAHKHVSVDEPIDLLNVAFENPHKLMVQAQGNTGGLPRKQKKEQQRRQIISEPIIHTSYMVPDRVTGLQELEELRRLCPGRVWNFESQSSRRVIQSLMFPGRTVMDMSLALALYFASRGIGQVRSSPDAESKQYTSTARVLLNGLGSDELLGGYGRHRSAFTTGGWKSVIEELQLEIDRIPTRNLGRDDRVISSHGKETRHPFLSLTVVNFLARLPVHLKMDPRLEVGIGDKLLLRLVARKVGLIEASERKKRAMQFGSHSARMEGERRGDTLLET